MTNADFYIVWGGVFTDTTFTNLIPETYEYHGVFSTYEKARAKWAERTWRNVDDCHHRMFIDPKVTEATP